MGDRVRVHRVLYISLLMAEGACTCHISMPKSVVVTVCSVEVYVHGQKRAWKLTRSESAAWAFSSDIS